MKSTYLSRQLSKEKTQCPGCGKTLQVGTLAWSHRCRVSKRLPDDVLQSRSKRQRDMAVESFQRRMQEQECATMEDTGDTSHSP
jgi:hypothetical protein